MVCKFTYLNSCECQNILIYVKLVVLKITSPVLKYLFTAKSRWVVSLDMFVVTNSFVVFVKL